MTPDSPPAHASAPRRAYRRLRVPAFYPVPVRTRRDGWTIERQADFLGLLAECGSVIGACEAFQPQPIELDFGFSINACGVSIGAPLGSGAGR